MNMDTQNLIDSYYKWLKDKTVWKQIEDIVEITTPYLDRHNDYIQIYLKQDGDGYILTDASYTIQDLEMSGCPLDSPKRQKLLTVTLNGFGVKIKDKELFVKATKENFAVNKHNLIQAILAVNDIFYLARANVASLFFEDVQGWLTLSEIRFSPGLSFNGVSGYNRRFDFAIPAFKDNPERIIQTINHPTRAKAEQLAFGWLDTKDSRLIPTKAYAVINDANNVPKQVNETLVNYDITPIWFSEKEKYIEQLAA